MIDCGAAPSVSMSAKGSRKTSPSASRMKRAANIVSGAGEPNKEKVGKLTLAQVREIATTKMPDLTAADMDAAVRTIAGTAHSMGIETEGVK